MFVIREAGGRDVAHLKFTLSALDKRLLLIHLDLDQITPLLYFTPRLHVLDLREISLFAIHRF